MIDWWIRCECFFFNRIWLLCFALKAGDVCDNRVMILRLVTQVKTNVVLSVIFWTSVKKWRNWGQTSTLSWRRWNERCERSNIASLSTSKTLQKFPWLKNAKLVSTLWKCLLIVSGFKSTECSRLSHMLKFAMHTCINRIWKSASGDTGSGMAWP